MCVGCREGFREVVGGGGLSDLSVHVVSSFPRLLTLAVAVAILAELFTLTSPVTARELAELG